MPSLRDVAHDGVLCTFSNRSDRDRGKWFSPSPSASLGTGGGEIKRVRGRNTFFMQTFFKLHEVVNNSKYYKPTF